MGKIGYIWVFLALFMASLTPLAGAVDSDNETPSRAGLEDPVEIEIRSFDTRLYPGESDSFYIQLYNYYDGSSFEGVSVPANSTEIKEVKISITGFYDEAEDPVTTPVNWITGTVYNNNGDGYTISGGSSRYFYADSSNNNQEYEIKIDDIKPGYYKIGVRAEFRYMVDWDGATLYEWADSSEMEFQSFEIRSFVGGSYYPDYRFQAYDENLGSDMLYAGATNKLLGVYNIYSASGTLTDVTATLAFPGGEISVRQPSVFNPDLPGTIYWRADVPEDLPPGMYNVEISFSYTRSGITITEMPTTHQVTVHYTPLLTAPQSEDLDDPHMTFSRNNLPTSLMVPFTNIGNVDLMKVTVNMDLDNTMYVDGSRYYISEENSGSSYQDDQEIYLGNITQDQTRTVNFEGLTFLPRLPPGLYKIPLDYSAYYVDDGSTGNTAREVLTGHWFDNGIYDHRNIMRDRAYPEDRNSDFRQFLLIEILEEPGGPLLAGTIDSGYNQDPGTVNARMRLRVDTHEMYQMKNLVYRIHTDGGSPFSMPFSSMNDTDHGTLSPILRAGLSESSGSYTQSDNFYFYANIKENAPPGINYFMVDVEGYTEFNQPFNTTFMADISIDSHQPRFELVSVDVGDILADRSVEITAEMINVGLGGAKNLTCFFKSSNSGYDGMDLPQEVGTVEPDGVFSYSFHVKPTSDRRYFNGIYSGNIYFSYYDDLGEYDDLMSGNNLYVRYDLYDKLPDLVVMNVDAPLVDSGDEFEVTVTVMNMGGSSTSGLKVLVPHSTSQFNIEDPEKELTDLAPGESIDITFKIKVEDEINDRTTYSFTMRFSYTNIMGRERNFGEGETQSFSVRTKDRIIPSEQRQIVEDDGVLVSEGAGNIILGILIFIGLIVFASMMTGGRIAAEKASKKKDKPQKKVIIEDDEEEDEEEDIEEEEDVEYDEDDEEEVDW